MLVFLNKKNMEVKTMGFFGKIAKVLLGIGIVYGIYKGVKCAVNKINNKDEDEWEDANENAWEDTDEDDE